MDKGIEVTCGVNSGLLHIGKFQTGSKGSCISFNGLWLTPNEFQHISGRGNVNNWKSSIKHSGRSLRTLLGKGELSSSDGVDVKQHARLATSRRELTNVVKKSDDTVSLLKKTEDDHCFINSNGLHRNNIYESIVSKPRFTECQERKDEIAFPQFPDLIFIANNAMDRVESEIRRNKLLEQKIEQYEAKINQLERNIQSCTSMCHKVKKLPPHKTNVKWESF
jgi:hypothetical protein